MRAVATSGYGLAVAVLCALAWSIPSATTIARADVCTGGVYPAAGQPPALLSAMVPLIDQPQWSRSVISLDDWPTRTNVATAWLRRVQLWRVQRGLSYWAVPITSCAGDDRVCIVVGSRIGTVVADCPTIASQKQGAPIVVKYRGSQVLVGFSLPSAASAEVMTASGSRVVLPAVKGVFGGEVPLGDGATTSVSFGPSRSLQTRAPVVLVDQTTTHLLPRGQLGPRDLNALSGRIAVATGRRATDVGHAVTGSRKLSVVLYRPGRRGLARRVATVLHSRAIQPLSGGPLKEFGAVADVVVLVGVHS